MYAPSEFCNNCVVESGFFLKIVQRDKTTNAHRTQYIIGIGVILLAFRVILSLVERPMTFRSDLCRTEIVERFRIDLFLKVESAGGRLVWRGGGWLGQKTRGIAGSNRWYDSRDPTTGSWPI